MKKWSTALGLALAALLLLLPQLMDRKDVYGIVVLNTAVIYSILVLGFNFIYGFTGILSLATVAFWGIGAYTSALLTINLGLSFWIALPGAAFIAAAFGILLGIPTLKLQSHYLTMTTIGFSEIIRLILLNYRKLTHGADGISNIPAPVLFGFKLSSPFTYYYLNLALLALVVFLALRIKNSRLGRGMEAIRDNEIAAEAMGVNTTYVKILAFAISAFCGGIAGSLYAHLLAYINPDTFIFDNTIRFLSMLLIGGLGTISGSIIGAVLLTYIPEWLRFLKDYYMTIYGLGVVLMMVFMPTGIGGFYQKALVAGENAPWGRRLGLGQRAR